MAVAVARSSVAQPVHKGFSADFVHEMRDQMMESLQSAARECVAQAAQRFEEEILQLQAGHKQELLNLQVQLQMSESRRQQSPCECKRRSECNAVETSQPDPCHKLHVCGLTDSGSASISAHPETKADQSTCSEPLPLHTPSRQITLVMTPVSSHTCSSSSCSPGSASRCASDEKAAGKCQLSGTPSETFAERASEKMLLLTQLEDTKATPSATKMCMDVELASSTSKADASQHLPSESKSAIPASPSKAHTALLAEVTPPRAPHTDEKSKQCRPLHHGGVDQGITADRTPPGKLHCAASPPLPAEPSFIGAPRERRRSSPHSKPADEIKAVANDHSTPCSKVVSMHDKSPTVLEPDTIEVLRAALVDKPDETSATPKPSRGPVMLPPAAVQGRCGGSSGDSNVPTPQGSPHVRLAFDTPRGGSTTPGQPVRTPKLSQILLSTPAGGNGNTPTQASVTAQDTQGSVTSPSRQQSSSELKNRRLSWPSSSPRNPVRAVVARVREASEADASATPMSPPYQALHRSNTKTMPELPHYATAEAPASTAAPKTMPEVEHDGGLIDGTALHGVASPLRRRWLGVLSGGASSAVTPKPPAQRL